MDITAVIIAAGMGKRMKSTLPKVLHKIANISFLEIILTTLTKLKIADIRIVVSTELQNHSDFKNLTQKFKFTSHLQKYPNGTAGAVNCAIKKDERKPILILNGDCPLIETKTIKRIFTTFNEYNTDVLCVGFEVKNPKGYGRLITFGDDLVEIIEDKDLVNNQFEINFCNSGLYMISPNHINDLLNKIKPNVKSDELYLTDIVKIANYDGLKVSFIEAKSREVLGINDAVQKAVAEEVLQNKLRKRALKAGVTLISPSTVFLSFDTNFGNDVTIHPFVEIGPNVTIGDNTEVLSFSHIIDSKIGNNCKIGPYARLRPNSVIGNHVHIGNFVEIKASNIGSGTKASHLSYIGDGIIGENANIGAGTIFCNFDGYTKHQTKIGNNTFVGSNVALIAPISIGDNAILGAGSVITEDVENNSLAIARARQSNYHQKADLIRKNKKK